MKMALRKEDIFCDICGFIMNARQMNQNLFLNGGYSKWYKSWANPPPSSQKEKSEIIMFCSNDNCSSCKSLRYKNENGGEEDA